ncbi:C2H2 finger domain protein, putative [Talaromyces marneffei ATCC 18224]|uniref:C2H2 finger domain protein, putative n=2 Tax=Talaromyces marneffei TaxID=37727 RepID=B6QM93_TALMQ|nr:C2H2 finger domain protein, putative [Talaromyces marneffei ATCC 18224]
MATHDQLNPLSAFNQQAFEDPYLSGPSDLEEFGFEQQQHTPSVSSADPPSRLSSLSPADQKLSSDASMHNYEYNDAPFDDSRYIDFNGPGSTDPLFLDDMLSVEDGQVSAFPNVDTYIQTKSEYQENEDQKPTQVLNHVSGGNQVSADATGQRQLQPSRLAIPDSAYSNDNSQGHNRTRSAPSLSPIVKISQVHRGDSPTRENDGWNPLKNKRSSVHLSPTGGSADDSDDQNEEISNSQRSLSPSRAEDGSWIPDASTGQAGVDPYARNDEFGPSPKDLEEQRQLAEKEVDIRIWSASVSVANSEAGDDSSPWEAPRGRTRAVSAVETRQDYFSLMRPDDSRIPGPGRLIHELDPGSDFETLSNISHADSHDGLPALDYTPEENQLAEQLNRAYPWKDEPRYSFPLAIKTQPETSRSAMQLYEEMAKEMDKASRVGTWGSSRRRLNDAEVDSLLKSDSFFKNLSLNTAAIRKLLPKRSSNSLKDKRRYFRQPSFEPEPTDPPQKKESGIAARLSRRPSLNRPKSPTHIMAAAIAGSMAASIGSHNSLSARSPVSPGGGSLSAVVPWSRSRSKSEGSGPTPLIRSLAIPTLEQRQGAQQKSSPLVESRASVGLDADEDDDDDSSDDKGIFMDLAPTLQQIVPTLEGFKRQISLLDPRLEPALLQRFAIEQLRRYKKLIDEQSRHVALAQSGHCDAGERCFASGGRAKLLPPRANAKDPGATYCQFQIPGHENSDDDDEFDEENNQSLENSIIPAVFADGIRMPPVKRLPAEFECSLCFKVKKFQKPSDWTKHIYEDIYPFTCTFPDCVGEPKSFKRKADWVRHETERHRHLEWWACNMPNCDHKCFRKNNFVQHLVREHRKPDPTAKKARGSAASGSANAAAHDTEIAKLWKQVEECHHETQKKPEEEPCRFCGNVCKDWRKLMVHLARHMERIALPVLRLAEEHSSSTNRTANIYEATPAPAPSISVYNSVEPNLSLNTNDMAGLGEPTMSDGNISSPMQPMMMPYDPQQGSHMLSPTRSMDMSPSGTTYPPASASSYLQPHYTPAHRNSMSYPPAPNANGMATRQPTTMPTASSSNIGPVIYQQLHISTIGLDAQEPLYQSPQDTCFNPDDYLPASTSVGVAGYTSAPMVNYTMPTSSETVPNGLDNVAYMQSAAAMTAAAAQMQDNSHTYPPATYHFQ